MTAHSRSRSIAEMGKGGGNPPESKWFSTPRAKRKRKSLSITLSDAERELAERLDKDHGEPGLSRVIAAALRVLAGLPAAAIARALQVVIEAKPAPPTPKRRSKKSS